MKGKFTTLKRPCSSQRQSHHLEFEVGVGYDIVNLGGECHPTVKNVWRRKSFRSRFQPSLKTSTFQFNINIRLHNRLTDDIVA